MIKMAKILEAIQRAEVSRQDTNATMMSILEKVEANSSNVERLNNQVESVLHIVNHWPTIVPHLNHIKANCSQLVGTKDNELRQLDNMALGIADVLKEAKDIKRHLSVGPEDQFCYKKSTFSLHGVVGQWTSRDGPQWQAIASMALGLLAILFIYVGCRLILG